MVEVGTVGSTVNGWSINHRCPIHMGQTTLRHKTRPDLPDWRHFIQSKSLKSNMDTKNDGFKTQKWLMPIVKVQSFDLVESQPRSSLFSPISTTPKPFPTSQTGNLLPCLSGATSLTSPLQTLLASTVREKNVSVSFFRSEQGAFDKSSEHCLCSALAVQVNLRDVGLLEDDDYLTSAQVWFHS